MSIKIQDSVLLKSSETRRRGVQGHARLPEAGPRAGLPSRWPRPIPEPPNCPRTLLSSPSVPSSPLVHSQSWLGGQIFNSFDPIQTDHSADLVSGASPSKYTVYRRGPESTAEDQTLPAACLLSLKSCLLISFGRCRLLHKGFLWLPQAGCWRGASLLTAHGLGCPVAYGTLKDQGRNPCAQHGRAGSWLLDYQGSPACFCI